MLDCCAYKRNFALQCAFMLEKSSKNYLKSCTSNAVVYKCSMKRRELGMRLFNTLTCRNMLPESYSGGRGGAQYKILNMNQILHSNDSSLMKQLLVKNQHRDISIVAAH